MGGPRYILANGWDIVQALQHAEMGLQRSRALAWCRRVANGLRPSLRLTASDFGLLVYAALFPTPKWI